jgi:thioredoxin 1
MIRISSSEQYKTDVLENTGFVLVDFWAEWCGPCKAMLPILDSLANQYGEFFVIAKVNADELPELLAEYNVTSIPTMILFNNGKVVTRVTGAKSRSALDLLLSSHVPS